MQTLATIARISIAPVKSMALEHPSAIDLETYGARGDRRYFVADSERRLFTGSRFGPLVSVRPEFGEGRLSLRFPDGTILEDAARPDGEEFTVSFHGRPVAARRVPGPWDAALSALVGEEVHLAEPREPGDARDDEPATIISLASVEAIGSELGLGTTLDPRRFRMLFDVEGLEPFEEDGWAGRQVRIGDAVVRVGEPVPRCVVTTQHPASGVVDARTLEAIERLRGRTPRGKLPLGVYATVERPGRVRVGDTVTPL